MINKSLILLLAILIAGCSSTKQEPTPEIRVINNTSYPYLLPMNPLPPLNILPWQHDFPRDMSVLSIKNTTACRAIETKSNVDKPYMIEPVEEQPDEYWAKCGEHPIMPASNIYVGFTQENWDIIIENFYKLKHRIYQYEQRIEEINKQRQEWRDQSNG